MQHWPANAHLERFNGWSLVNRRIQPAEINLGNNRGCSVNMAMMIRYACKVKNIENDSHGLLVPLGVETKQILR